MSKILLIEDDILTIRMYTKAFTFENFHVEVAFNEAESVQKAKAVRPTVILLDVMNPHDKKFQVLEKLKQDPDTKDFPVVIMANIYEEAYVDIALSKGAIRYIDKFASEPKEILKIVKEIIVSTTSSY